MIPCAILLHCYDLEDVQALVEATQFLDEHQIRRGRVGHIYSTNVRYRREEHDTLPGVERVQTAEETNAMGDGDCDDLGPWLAASRTVIDGEPCRVKAVQTSAGYHIVVEYPDGQIEDPSARLGMLGDVPSAKQRRKAKLRSLAGNLLRHATSATQMAARMNPYSAAARGLLGLAKKAATAARQHAENAERDEDAPTTPPTLEASASAAADAASDEGDDDAPETVEGIEGRAKRVRRRQKRRTSAKKERQKGRADRKGGKGGDEGEDGASDPQGGGDDASLEQSAMQAADAAAASPSAPTTPPDAPPFDEIIDAEFEEDDR